MTDEAVPTPTKQKVAPWEDITEHLRPSLHYRKLKQQIIAHLKFVIRLDYLKLAYAALVGRSLKILGTLFGWLVTPLYKRFINPEYIETNVLYDKLSPFLRRWFQQLSSQRYELRSILLMIALERRGAVICEAILTIIQIVLYRNPVLLLPVTVIGVLVNAIPRQFYAQLKMLMRSLHLGFMVGFMDMLTRLVRNKKATYGGRPVFSETGRETPEKYLAFRGSHHAGCRSVVIREFLDLVLSAIGGVLMLYLLLVSLAQFLVLVAATSESTFESWFPFWAVTAARVFKTACNYCTTENLLKAVLARQTQVEIYFLQKLQVVRSEYSNPAQFVDDICEQTGCCARQPFQMLEIPPLEGELPFDFHVDGMCMFAFLVQPVNQIPRYHELLDEAMQPPWKNDDMNTCLRDGKSRPPAFTSTEELNELRNYSARLLWYIFDNSTHQKCKEHAHVHVRDRSYLLEKDCLDAHTFNLGINV